jgi:PhnB protein
MAKSKKSPKTRKGSIAPAATRKKASPKRRASRETHAAVSHPFRTLTPYIAVHDARQAIEWYKRTFGAREVSRMNTPDGKILHCELLIGDSRFMLSDIFPGSDMVDPKLTGSCVAVHIYGKNIDELYHRAVENGSQVTLALENQFWGDRYGKIRDPFGHIWSFGYPAKMTKQERDAKAKAAMSMFAAGGR